MDSTRSKRTHRQGYPSGLGRQWLCDCEAESVTHLGAMSASGPGCVKTPTTYPFLATPHTTQVSPQSTVLASSSSESWLPMDSDISQRSNCNVNGCRRSKEFHFQLVDSFPSRSARSTSLRNRQRVGSEFGSSLDRYPNKPMMTARAATLPKIATLAPCA
jgi:hypothetical protein